MDNNSNSSYELATGQPWDLNTRRIIMLAVDIIMFIIGFVGNGSVIYLTMRQKTLRTVPNLLITNLALGDMMVVLLIILVNILHAIFHSVISPLLYRYCEFFLFIQFLSLGVSVLTLTVLSVDRYTTVAFPMHKQHYAKRLTVWTIAGIWLLSFTIVGPLWFGLIDDTMCWFTNPDSYTAYLIALVLFLFVLPTIVMVTCYCLTAIKLVQSNNFLKLDKLGGQKQQRQRSRLAIIVLIMTIAFILCSSFLYAWLIAFRISPSHPFVQNMVVKELKSILNKVNSIVNPIILYLMSSTYRRHFLKQFCCYFHSSKRKREKSTLSRSNTQPCISKGMSQSHMPGNEERTIVSTRMAPIKEADSQI